MKILFHLKGGQKGELLLNLIFPDYPNGSDGENGNDNNAPENEKETDNAVSNSAGCAYTPVMVEVRGVEPLFKREVKILSTYLADLFFCCAGAVGRQSARGLEC